MWGTVGAGTLGGGAVCVRPGVGMEELGTIGSDAGCVTPTVVVGGVGTVGSGVMVADFVLYVVSWLKMLFSAWITSI